MLVLLVASLLLVQEPEIAPPLSLEARALIAPVLDVIEGEQARQAALPPPTDHNERFLRMYRLDQQSRMALNSIDLSVLSDDQRQTAERVMWDAINAVDEQNQKTLLQMIPPEGWFYKSVYGEGPANTAFLIVQHSNADLWRRFLPVLEPLVATGEVDGESYGLMYDRLAVNEKRPQRYGSQVTCKGGRYVIDWANLEDPEQVDERRAAMGFHQTIAEYEQNFADHPPCEDS